MTSYVTRRIHDVRARCHPARMTPRAATRRSSLTVFGVSACLGCAPFVTGAPRDAHQWLRAFCSVRFSSSHEITLITNRSAADSETSRLSRIVEIGGRVVAYRGDTLVIEPFYVTTAPGVGTDRITAYPSGHASFPDFALVPIEEGVAIGDFHPPHRPRSAEQTVAVALGMGMLLILLYTDVVLLVSR